MADPEKQRTTRLSASDMSSLLAERGPIHVHVGGTAIFSGKPPDFEEFLAHVERRLALIPRFRQRVTSDALQLSNPVWADDPRFDIRWHVRHAALPKPGSVDQLRELIGRIMSQPLDMSRPLWQLYLIEGLEQGGAIGKRRFAALSKTHHALVDGVSAIDVGMAILDPDEKGELIEVPEEPWDPEHPRAAELIAGAVSQRLGAPLRVAREATRRALNPRSTASAALKTAEGFARMASGGPTAPRTSFNVEIGRDRRLSWVRATLDDLRHARGASPGATVNDAILAAASGGLGRLFERRGEPTPDELVALVPMSLRTPEDETGLGNRIATLMVALPVGEPDPVERLRRVHATTDELKRSQQAQAASLVIEAAGLTPPTINRVLAAGISRPLTWNLVVSNVPGPPVSLYLLGRRLEEIYPYVPLSPQGHALAIGAVSYSGKVQFGLVGDRDAMADLDDFAEDLKAALDEQIEAAGPP